MSTRQGGLAASSAQKRATYPPIVSQDNRPSETMGPQHSPLTTSQTKVSKPALSAAVRLKRSFDFWKNTLKANKLILSVILHGYRIPFVELPTACNNNNNNNGPVSNTKCHSIGHKMRIARIKIRVDSPGRWEKSLGRESNFEEVCFEPGTEYW